MYRRCLHVDEAMLLEAGKLHEGVGWNCTLGVQLDMTDADPVDEGQQDRLFAHLFATYFLWLRGRQ